jgi:hypothetical protein
VIAKLVAAVLAIAGLAIAGWLWKGDIEEKAVLEASQAAIEQELEREKKARIDDQVVITQYEEELHALESVPVSDPVPRIVRVCPDPAGDAAAGGSVAAGAGEDAASAGLFQPVVEADLGDDLRQIEMLGVEADLLSAQLRAVLERERRRVARTH